MFLGLALAGCSARTKLPAGYQGVVELDERIVAAEVPGKVVSVSVKRGDAVPPGAIVATLDDSLERLTRDARRHEAEAAHADLALLQAGARREDLGALSAQIRAASATEALLAKSVDRARALRESGAVPQTELDRAEAELARITGEKQSLEQRLAGLRGGARSQEIARARARAASADSAVAIVDERLGRYSPRVASGANLGGGPPDAGGPARVVLDGHGGPGELAGVGTPLATIADAGHPYVDVFVPQKDIDGVRVGARASLRVDSTRDPFPGAVENVSRTAEFTPRFLFSERERPNIVVRVRVRIDDPGRRLHAGVPAFVQIEP